MKKYFLYVTPSSDVTKKNVSINIFYKYDNYYNLEAFLCPGMNSRLASIC